MRKFIQYCLAAVLLLQMTACVDQEFDVPPGREVQTGDISTTTIAALKATHQIGADASAIAAGTVIKGTVISNDTEGSFYKEMIIQDETAGILLRVDRGDLSVTYGPGRQVFVKCDDLYIGDYNGLIQIGYPGEEATAIDRIPDIFVEKHIILGAEVGTVTPRVVSKISDLRDDMVSTLITLSDVEFGTSYIGQELASQDGFNTQNKDVFDCAEDKVVFRASKFADYSSAIVPAENGSITAILSKYQETYQISIATLADMDLKNPRCDGNTGGGVTGDKIDIKDLQTLFASGAEVAPNGYIEGVVISDYSQSNINNRNLVVQGATAGIIVRLGNEHAIPLGESVQVSTNGASLSEFNGGLQINVDNFSVVQNGAGTLPEPRVTTIAELLNNFQAWESTLVKVVDAELSGGSTFSAINTITDATGSIATFTFNFADFANDAAPTGKVDVTGIVSEYNDMQITFRSRADIVGGTTGGTGGTGDLITLEDMRTAFEGGATAAANGFIEGVVISDYTTGSVTGRNLHIQDATGGIVVRFADNHEYALGAKLKINVGGTELSEYNGLLQLNNVEASQVESVSTGDLPSPRMATLAEITSNLEDWESTLVVIENVTFSGNSVFEGALTADDGTASLTMYTRGAATFASSNVPSGPVTVTAIVTQFNDAQILIRSLDDLN